MGAMDAPDRKALSRLFLARTEVIAPEGRYVERIKVTAQAWVRDFCEVPNEWQMPKKVYRRAE